MGFWGSLWSGVKAVGNFCAKAVEVVTKPITMVTSYVGKKLNQAKDWFLEETSIGRKIYQGYNFVMENTGIRKGLNWVKEKVSSAKEWFDNTSVGKCVNAVMPLIQIAGIAMGGVPGLIVRGLTTAKNVVNAVINNPLSLIPGYGDFTNRLLNNRFTQALNPVKNYVSEKFVQIKQKVYNVSSKVNESIKNSKFGQYVTQGIQKTTKFTAETYSKVNESIQNSKAGQFCFSNYEKLKNSSQKLITKVAENQYIKKGLQNINSLKGNALKYGRQYAPHIYQAGSRVFETTKESLKYLGQGVNKIYEKNIRNTQYGRKIDKGINICNKFAFKPTKKLGQMVWNMSGKPLVNYGWRKIEETETFKKYLETPIKTFHEIKNQAKHIGAKKIINKSEFGLKLKNQNTQNGIDSSNFLASYLNKYDCKSQKIQEIKKNFVSVDNYCRKLPNQSKEKINQKNQMIQENVNSTINKEVRQIPTLNSLVNSGKVKIESLSFDASKGRGKSYTIEGKMEVQNKTREKVEFQILPGQIFGCSKAKTSQHTVARGLKGSIEPNEKKEITLESFCGDSGLKWPYDDKNYTMTNYLLRQFEEGMDQKTVWNCTN